MKVCSHCRKSKPLELFGKNSSKRDGLQNCCRECKRIIDSSHYKSSPIRKGAIRKRNAEIASHNRKLVRRYKTLKGCAYCSEKCYACLDFHHPDSDKEFNISRGYSNSTETLKAEIRKCVVVCSNCHRKIHSGIFSSLS